MTYIVTDACVKCKFMDCVEVCPVDCFYEGENFLVIAPDECIDCGVCEPECPVDAIVPDTEDPANPSASTLTATIPLTDVAPNDDRLKAHLQTDDFFDTANHPTATFVSRSVTVDTDDANEATVVGDLTLRVTALRIEALGERRGPAEEARALYSIILGSGEAGSIGQR